VINLIFLGYLALMGLAAVLRWRYRVWLLLVLGTLVAVVVDWLYVGLERAKAPLYTKEVAAELRARPWPADPADLARLIASFKAIGDFQDANVLRPLYQLEVARGLAGELPERFGTVAEALAWKPADTAPHTRTSTWREGMNAERRALNGMLEVKVPRVSAWPPELARDAPLGEGARQVAPGVWIVPKQTNTLVGTLRFPLSVYHRGKVGITTAYLTVFVSQPGRAADARSPGFCHATLQDVAPGETRWISCDLTVGTKSEPAIHSLLDKIEQLRAGELSIGVRVGGELDASVRKVPDAEPLIPGEIQRLQELKQQDKQMMARRRERVPILLILLFHGSIFALGFLIPGLAKRSLSVVATLAFALAGGAVAFVAGLVFAARTPGVRGWELIIAVITTLAYGGLFIGGLLFGNLVYLRQKNS
jgi:hypothetical protein